MHCQAMQMQHTLQHRHVTHTDDGMFSGMSLRVVYLDVDPTTIDSDARSAMSHTEPAHKTH